MASSDTCFENAQKMLADTSRLLDNIMYSMGDGLSIQDLNMRIVYQNKFMEDHFGPHVGEYCYRVYENRDTLCDGCPVVEACRTGNVTKALRVGITRDGTPFRFENIASPLRNEQGEIVAGMELCRIVEDREKAFDDLRATMQQLRQTEEQLTHDISERKRAEEELKESESLLRNVLKVLKVGIVMIDAQSFEVAYVNQTALDLIGLAQERVLGKKCVDLICPSAAEPGGWDGCPVIKHGKRVINKEDHLNLPGGRKLHVARSVFSTSRDGRDYLIEIFSDISERKALEMQLLHSQKMESMGRLAGGIAHEVNNPAQYVGDNIRFIQDFFQGLLPVLDDLSLFIAEAAKGKADPELARKIELAWKDADPDLIKEDIPAALDQSQEGMERIVRIVRAMKNFAQSGAGGRTFEDINDYLTDLVEVSRNEWSRSAELKTDFNQDLPPVPGLHMDLKQAFLNILINAAQATEAVANNTGEKGLITLVTSLDNEFVKVRISDTGPGIPQANQARIFDQFFTTREVGQGAGQGLAVAYSIIVDTHGGTITLETEEGQGTTFIVRLPLKESALEKKS